MRACTCGSAVVLRGLPLVVALVPHLGMLLAVPLPLLHLLRIQQAADGPLRSLRRLPWIHAYHLGIFLPHHGLRRIPRNPLLRAQDLRRHQDRLIATPTVDIICPNVHGFAAIHRK